jgi:hypothetical protein
MGLGVTYVFPQNRNRIRSHPRHHVEGRIRAVEAESTSLVVGPQQEEFVLEIVEQSGQNQLQVPVQREPLEVEWSTLEWEALEQLK